MKKKALRKTDLVFPGAEDISAPLEEGVVELVLPPAGLLLAHHVAATPVQVEEHGEGARHELLVVHGAVQRTAAHQLLHWHVVAHGAVGISETVGAAEHVCSVRLASHAKVRVGPVHGARACHPSLAASHQTLRRLRDVRVHEARLQRKRAFRNMQVA